MISQILDRLYVGDYEFRCEDLKELGITHVINVGEVELSYGTVSYWIRLSDDGQNQRWKFYTALNRLGAALSHTWSSRVLVCCRAGISRSVFIILLWLQKMGMSRDEAYEFIKKKHPIAQVNLDLLRSV